MSGGIYSLTSTSNNLLLYFILFYLSLSRLKQRYYLSKPIEFCGLYLIIRCIRHNNTVDIISCNLFFCICDSGRSIYLVQRFSIFLWMRVIVCEYVWLRVMSKQHQQVDSCCYFVVIYWYRSYFANDTVVTVVAYAFCANKGIAQFYYELQTYIRTQMHEACM